MKPSRTWAGANADVRRLGISCPVWGSLWHLVGMTTLTKGEVFQRYGVELTRFATSLVGPADSQDVVSDAFVSALWSDGWDRVEDQRAYLYRTVVSRARMNHRSAMRRRNRERRAAPVLTVAPPTAEIDVWNAMAHLNVVERSVVFLTYWEDLTEVDVAGRLGMSERTVRRHLGRARDKLGRLLDV